MKQKYPVNQTQKTFPVPNHIKLKQGCWDQQIAPAAGGNSGILVSSILWLHYLYCTNSQGAMSI